MSLKYKFISMGVLVFVSMWCLVLLGNFKVDKVHNFSNMDLQLANVEKGMLQLRRDEKDFLARIDIKYKGKFENHYSQLLADVDALEQATLTVGVSTDQIDVLRANLAQYNDLFGSLTDIQGIIGFNPKDGLYGTLRSSIHSAEKSINAVNNQQLRAEMLQLRRNEKDFMLRLDPKYVDKFNKQINAFYEKLSASYIESDVQQEIRTNVKNYKTHFTTLVDASVKKGLSSNQGIQGDMRNAIHQVESVLETLSETTRQTISDNLGSLDRMKWQVTIVSFILTVVLLGISTLIVMGVLRPLQALMNTMTESTTNNDLTLRMTVGNQDEIGKTATAFNSMMDKFQNIITMMSGSSTHIASATGQMSATSMEANSSIQEQKAQIQQLSAAMSEMSSAVNSVAESTSSAADAAKIAKRECTDGRQVVDTASNTITTLASSVQSAVEAISLVAQDSNSIGSVLEVIRGIAEQTNLLALNAAIEAARAGEQGRGFAVVADEVRTLAGRTQDSTEEIHNMISSLQARSQEAVNLMNESHSNTQVGVEQTASVDSALSLIAKAVDDINVMNEQIAAAAFEQSQVTEEVNRNVCSIDQVAERSAAGAKEIANSSGDLATLSEELSSIASRFKVH